MTTPHRTADAADLRSTHLTGGSPLPGPHRSSGAATARQRALLTAFEHSPCATAMLDRANRITEVNPTLMVLLGRPASALLGHTPGSLLEADAPADAPAGEALDELMGAGGELPRHDLTVYRRYRHPDGQLLYLQVSYSPAQGGPAARPGLLHLVDLTMVQSLGDQLEEVTQVDALTGLPNREAFGAALRRRLDRPDPAFVVGHLDVTRFGLVNDALGRSAADAALVEIGRRLRAAPGVGLAGRPGGDEFLFSVEGRESTREAPRRTVAGLLEAVGRPIDLGGYRVVLAGRVGLARSADATDADQLIGRAETATREAKRTGASISLWHPASRDRSYQRLKIEGALRQADFDTELTLHYQPVWDLSTRSVGSVEALLRWNHPSLGLIPPDRFLPVAVDLGQAVEVGDWVLRHATRALRAWRCQHSGATPRVAVNLCGEHVGDPILVDTVRRALDASGADPTMLVLEITEQALVTASSPVLRRLHRLADAGVEIHLDDFGTGYSSLAYLNRLPVQGLKVDRQFVSGDTGLLLLRTIARLGRELGKAVVAEGVETSTQLQAVRSAGCTAAQGYLLGRPTGDLDAALARRPVPALAGAR